MFMILILMRVRNVLTSISRFLYPVSLSIPQAGGSVVSQIPKLQHGLVCKRMDSQAPKVV